jgi:predicted glycosyltransferase
MSSEGSLDAPSSASPELSSEKEENMPSENVLSEFRAAGLDKSPRGNTALKRIWVDLDNSPHVPFFRPIIENLREESYEVLVTARDAYQVRQLIDYYGVSAKIVGRHYGKHKVLKALGTCGRALALIQVVRKQKPDLAICHGSRGLLLACTLLRIPSVALMDYEFGAELPFIKPTWLMVPSVLSKNKMGFHSGVITYPGLKEDVYLSLFQPDRTLRKRLGIAADDVLIIVRPPATEAHYHNPEGDKLFTEVLNRFANNRGTKILLLPRNKRQETELRSVWAEPIASGRLLIPAHVEDGLNLIWNSDLVISGGGTMNREAAAMGVPVYSIFRGQIGVVDRYLADQGRLVLLESVEDVRTKIKAVYREKVASRADGIASSTLKAIVREIISLVEFKTVTSQARPN